MQSKNKPSPSAAARRHIAALKDQPCAVCDEPVPVEIHEIKQGQWFTSVPLCTDCHRGPLLGIHGQKRAWSIRHMDELDALAKTVERVLA